jgi:hypothetical protein
MNQGAKLRALGNVLRHEYDHMEGDRIWFMLEDDLAAPECSLATGPSKADSPERRPVCRSKLT